VAVKYHGGTRLFLTSRKDEGSAEPVDPLLFYAEHCRGVRATRCPRRELSRDAASDDSGVEEWMAFFEDPDGQLVALMSQVTREAAKAGRARCFCKLNDGAIDRLNELKLPTLIMLGDLDHLQREEAELLARATSQARASLSFREADI
jgi:hypothetical protein